MYSMPEWEASRSNNKHFAVYVLQNMSFGLVMEYKENWCQKGQTNDQHQSEKRSDLTFVFLWNDETCLGIRNFDGLGGRKT